MRAALFLMFLLALSTTARADALPWTHTRAMSPAAGRLLQMATERSALVRGLLDDLDRTDVVVLFMYSVEPHDRSRHPHMRFLTAVGTTRYVAVQMYWKPEPPVTLIPKLAHELQHSLELASHPEVCDIDSCARLFASIGWTVGPQRFETQAARVVEARVREELAADRHIY